MPSNPKPDEWRLLKDQFDALIRDEDVHERNMEMFLDDGIGHRFVDSLGSTAWNQN